MILLQILSAIAIITFIFLVFRLIKTLDKAEIMMSKSAKSLDEITQEIHSLTVTGTEVLNDIKSLKQKAEISIEKLNSLSIELYNISRKGHEYFNTIRDLSKPYEELVRNTYPVIAEPVQKTVSIINATVKAISVFKNRLSNKQK